MDEDLGIIPKKYVLLMDVDLIDKKAISKFKYYVYLITDWACEPSIQNEEHSEINWFSRAELDTLPLVSAKYLPIIRK